MVEVKPNAPPLANAATRGIRLKQSFLLCWSWFTASHIAWANHALNMQERQNSLQGSARAMKRLASCAGEPPLFIYSKQKLQSKLNMPRALSGQNPPERRRAQKIIRQIEVRMIEHIES